VAEEVALAEAGLALGPGGRKRIGLARSGENWLVFVFDRDHKAAFAERMTRLSRLGPAVACCVDERVGYMDARGYEGEREVWRVLRPDMPEDLELEVSGTPPPQFESIYEAAKAAEQAAKADDATDDDADEFPPFVIDVPALLVKSVCGYRFDDDAALADVHDAKAPGRSGFFARLFGRG
jgi:hypothetical protein